MTDTNLAEEQAIFARLDANFDSADKVFPNFEYTPVEGTSYVEFDIRRQEGRRMTIGPNEKRFPGLLIAKIRTPLNKGYAEGQTLADEIVAILDAVTFSQITFRTPTAEAGRRDPENEGWWRVDVTAPYFRNTYA